MNSDLIFKNIEIDSHDFNEFNGMYEEAFPIDERPCSLKKLVELCDESNDRFAIGVFDKDVPVGMTVYIKHDEYLYILYLVTNAKIRSRGYGTRILQYLINNNSNFKIYGFAETPLENANNYEQRIARKKFYEKNGFLYSKYKYSYKGDDMTIFTNFSHDLIPDCVNNALSRLGNILKITDIFIMKDFL